MRVRAAAWAAVLAVAVLAGANVAAAESAPAAGTGDGRVGSRPSGHLTTSTAHLSVPFVRGADGQVGPAQGSAAQLWVVGDSGFRYTAPATTERERGLAASMDTAPQRLIVLLGRGRGNADRARVLARLRRALTNKHKVRGRSGTTNRGALP